MNETIELLLNRGSLRTYANKQVTPEDLNTILECTLRAPTAGNMMMYSILVIQDQETKAKLAKSCDNQPFIAKAPTLLVFLADFNKWYQYYKQNATQAFCESKGEGFEGPSEGNLMLATQDSVIAAQNAVMAAQALGLGTCYIGDILENYEYHKELLQLPDYVYPVTMLTLGYYPENYTIPLRGRFDAKHVVFHEAYQTLAPDEIDEMFESRDKLYTEKNKFGANNYAQMHYCFKTKSDFSKEMTRSVKLALAEFSSKPIK